MSDQFSAFLKRFPLPYFRLDANDHIVDANDAWLQARGYQSLEEVKDGPIYPQWVSEEQAKQISRILKTEDYLEDQLNDLIRKDGSRFDAAVYTQRLTDENGNYAGREGFLFDVTEREIHRSLAKMGPTGYYQLEQRNGSEIITYCTKEFANIFGFDSPDQARGYNIKDVYAFPTDYDQLQEEIRRTNGLHIHHRRKQVKKFSSSESFWVESHYYLHRDQNGNCVRRIGAIRDISSESSLRHLNTEFGKVLHTFTSNLVGIEADMQTARTSLGVNPFPFTPRLDHRDVLNEMMPQVELLEDSLSRLLTILEEREKDDLSQQFSEQLERLSLAQKAHPAVATRALYDVAADIVVLRKPLREERVVARQLDKKVRGNAYNVMRIYALAQLHERQSDLSGMQIEINMLRDIVIQGETGRRPYTQFVLYEILELAVQQLNGFAHNQGVEIRMPAQAPLATVYADERDMQRAISNLLHNAIKYSWSRRGRDNTWIDIDLRKAKKHIILTITNYGVPILQDEIDSGAVFRFGVRSRLSVDRGRMGTGIGLADAQETIRVARGQISIASHPASQGGIAEEGDPFLTTATVTLPIHT